MFQSPNRRIFGRKTSKGQLCTSAEEGRTVPMLRCNREELKMLALREHRNRESIAEVIKYQSTPEVDSETNIR